MSATEHPSWASGGQAMTDIVLSRLLKVVFVGASALAQCRGKGQRTGLPTGMPPVPVLVDRNDSRSIASITPQGESGPTFKRSSAALASEVGIASSIPP